MNTQPAVFSTGIVQYGHLYGERAFFVTFTGDGELSTIAQIVAAAKASGEGRVVIDADISVPLRYLNDLSVALAEEGLPNAGLIRPMVCAFPPLLATKSILVVETQDHVDAALTGAVDSRVASVNVHGWWGSAVCRRLASDVPAPLGRAISATEGDYEAAMEWVASPECTAKWTVRYIEEP